MSKQNERLAPNEYRCAMCKNVYTKEIRDEEAMEETLRYWPGAILVECAVVCDDCWQKINPEGNRSRSIRKA